MFNRLQRIFLWFFVDTGGQYAIESDRKKSEMQKSILFFVIIAFGLTTGQHVVDRDCLTRPVFQNFDLNKVS